MTCQRCRRPCDATYAAHDGQVCLECATRKPDAKAHGPECDGIATVWYKRGETIYKNALAADAVHDTEETVAEHFKRTHPGTKVLSVRIRPVRRATDGASSDADANNQPKEKP